jgi:hypothetical protein
MNIQELMYTIPQPIVEIIIKWTLEFHRADAIERAHNFHSNFDTNMKLICEDVRMNTPVYKFSIRTISNQIIYLNLFLPNCDPYTVRPHQIPESRIDGFIRRGIALSPRY